MSMNEITTEYEVRFLCFDLAANHHTGLEHIYKHRIYREEVAYKVLYKLEEFHLDPENQMLQGWFLNTYGPEIELRDLLGIWKLETVAEQLCGSITKGETSGS